MGLRYPQSRREAEEHIREIRRSKHLDDAPENNAKDLASALKFLSDDLYKTTTHFLFELIQNADDNDYAAGTTPTLALTYSPGRVRIDCNERGFAKQHVDSLCRINASTKSGRSKASGFVGEKGIGFKAVFKVASQVWISSGHYSFRFDRDGHLGMIAPIWADFPESPRPGFTSILLKLDDDCDQKTIVDELQAYDEKILLFLRRLKRLEIGVHLGILRGGNADRTLCRLEEVNAPTTRDGGNSDSGSASPSFVTITNDDTEKFFFVWRHRASNMPVEERRPGIKTSEMVLAFPFERDRREGARPIIRDQSVYAFLPIRDYGFWFLLQADFLLPVSREDVHVDLPWNKALASEVPAAFLGAVTHMCTMDNPLRHLWIHYLPIKTSHLPFFETVRKEIIRTVAMAAILETEAGTKEMPMNLVIMPDEYRDPDGRPFTMTPRNARRYLSPAYHKSDFDLSNIVLAAISVFKLQDSDFGKELADAIGNDPEEFFFRRSAAWHDAFAQTLYGLRDRVTLLDLPIVPLQSGAWVSVSRNAPSSLYFPTSQFTTSSVPAGIGVSLVSQASASSAPRRILLDYLGVWALSDEAIRRKIKIVHENPSFKPDGLSVETIVSHARFLFTTRENAKNDVFPIWMAAEDGPARKSDTMYLPTAAPNTANDILPKGPDKSYGFLHRAYLDDDATAWTDYLETAHEVRIYPRLFNEKHCHDTQWGAGVIAEAIPAAITTWDDLSPLIHPDFQLLLRDPRKNKWLVVLRDGWDYYKKWLDQEGTTGAGIPIHRTQELLKSLGRVQVLCINGAPPHKRGAHRVSETWMMLDSLTAEYAMVPFVDVPDYNDERWEPVLKSLGVRFAADADFYIQCLEAAKVNEKTSEKRINQILCDLEARAEGDQNEQLKIRDAFLKPLIPIPSSASHTGERAWVTRQKCFWRGDAGLTQSVGLERIYPSLETLFRTYLLISNVDLTHLIFEATAIRSLTPPLLPRVEWLFRLFSKHVQVTDLSPKQKDTLRSLKMFPTTSSSSTTHMHEAHKFDCFMSADDTSPWLIADRRNFKEQFAGVLPLLALSPEFVCAIRPFLEALDLQDLFLSRVATSVTEARGDVELHEELTEMFRQRSKFLFRLIPDTQEDVRQIREKFRNVDVYTAPGIVQYYNAPLALRQVQSSPAKGTAFLESDYAGDLRVYVSPGSEREPHPVELADQLRNFFNVVPENRDLIAVALTAPEERVEEIFGTRGVAPLLPDDDIAYGEGSSGDNGLAMYAPVEEEPLAGPSKKKGKGLADGASRFSRLFSNARFTPSFFKKTDGDSGMPSGAPPSYEAAVARSTQIAIGKPVEPRTFAGALTLPALKGALVDLEFTQRQGVVLGSRPSPPSFVDRVFGATQRNTHVAEMIVSDVLSAVLGGEYDRSRMWTAKDKRTRDQATFNFTDTQGRFSAFLMRLDGIPGRAQGYTRMIYHLDVKVAESGTFRITQEELDRAREHSVHSQPDPSEGPASKHVSVLVHIENVRDEPKIRFLADPWDLFEDGQLTLQNAKSYEARLELRLLQGSSRGGVPAEEAGFDTVQIRPREGSPGQKYTPSPRYEEKGKGRSSVDAK